MFDHPPDPLIPIPHYLEQSYWWAYVHPNAVTFFEREWLVSLILFGNYSRLCHAVLTELSGECNTSILQIACVYGNLTARLQQRLPLEARLDIVDILPIQLKNLAKKLVPDERIKMWQGNAAALAFPDASYDQVLLFFLLHEQPEEVRRATLSEAMRVVKPGGKIIIVDYHKPVWWHPVRPLMKLIFHQLEPYAIDLWQYEMTAFLPHTMKPTAIHKSTYFGNLYQKLVLTR